MSSSIVVTLISNNESYPDLQIQTTDSNPSTTLAIGRNAQSKIQTARCARQQGTHIII
jgi:hypothetical protein